MRGFYVTVRDGARSGKLLGPYATHIEALALVETARAIASEGNPDAHFYGFGTAKVTAPTLSPGLLNDRVSFPVSIRVPRGTPRVWEPRKVS